MIAGAHKLRPDEWKGGDRAWLMELIAPFGGVEEMIEDLKTSIFPGRSFKFHRVTPEGKREVATLDGAPRTVN